VYMIIHHVNCRVAPVHPSPVVYRPNVRSSRKPLYSEILFKCSFSALFYLTLEVSTIDLLIDFLVKYSITARVMCAARLSTTHDERDEGNTSRR